MLASFAAYAAFRSPVPGVNEPHYLCKAKHYWNPSWCRGDFFLESANAHVVFYQAVGALTRLASLEQTAWIGRILAWTLLAIGWTAFVSRLVPGRWSALWAAWIYLLIAAEGNFSGEWIVGGVESKVFAYGFAFLGLAFAFDGRWNRAALLAGAGIAFHPVVGIWTVLAAVFACIVGRLGQSTAPAAGGSARRWVVAACLLILAALPGLIPAVGMLANASDEIAARADQIQVFYRLRHHLDPATFGGAAYAKYAGLLVVWFVGRRWMLTPEPEPQSVGSRTIASGNPERFFFWFVIGCVLIAMAGLAIGYWPDALLPSSASHVKAKLLKFYPFRLFDVMVPVAVAVTITGLLSRWTAGNTTSGPHPIPQRGRQMLAWGVTAAALAYACLLPAVDSNPSRLSAAERRDWLDVCGWISENTPTESQIVTPRGSWAFNWYAQRPEFFSRKDCPQDARGIIEWYRRLLALRSWAQDSFEDGYSDEDLSRLAQAEQVTHLVTHRRVLVRPEPLYQNDTYRVYELDRATTGTP